MEPTAHTDPANACPAVTDRDDVDPANTGPAAAIRARRRGEFLAGNVHTESPLHDGGRWGISVVFRSTARQMHALARLGKEAADIAGPGHWVHAPGELHVTIRTLEAHRSHVAPDDPLLTTYTRALNEAASGLPPARLRFRGLSPHPSGVAAVARSCDDTADTLRERLRKILQQYEIPTLETRRRTDWYANLLHFAAPVSDPHALVAWCDEHADLQLGEVVFASAELVRWRWDGTTVRMVEGPAAHLNGAGTLSATDQRHPPCAAGVQPS